MRIKITWRLLRYAIWLSTVFLIAPANGVETAKNSAERLLQIEEMLYVVGSIYQVAKLCGARERALNGYYDRNADDEDFVQRGYATRAQLDKAFEVGKAGGDAIYSYHKNRKTMGDLCLTAGILVEMSWGEELTERYKFMSKHGGPYQTLQKWKAGGKLQQPEKSNRSSVMHKCVSKDGSITFTDREC